MSALVQVPGIVQKPTCVRLTTTGITAVYTAADNFDTVISIMVTNEDAAARTILVDWFDGTTNNHILSKNLAANESFAFDQPIKLLNGNIIRGTAGTANTITVAVVAVKAMRNTAAVA